MEQIRQLSPSRLQEGLAVQLEGIVTFCDERSRQLLLQDGSGGIAIELNAPLMGIGAGDRISVSGFSAFEAFAPRIVKPRLTRVGSGSQPLSIKADPAQLFSGRMDFRRVELDCEALAAATAGFSSFELQVRSGSHTFRVVCKLMSRVPIYRLAHAQLRLQGVPVTTFNPSGDVHSLTLFASDPDDLQLLSPLPEESNRHKTDITFSPWFQPLPLLTTVSAIKTMPNQEADKGFPVRIQGTVTYWDPKRDQLILQDPTGGIYVRPPQHPVPGLEIGCLLELEGTTAGGAFSPVLNPRTWRVRDRCPMPAPIAVQPSEGFSALNDNRWTVIDGIIRRVTPGDFGEARLSMAAGQIPFHVTLLSPPPLRELEELVDRHVKVQGVYAPIFSLDQKILGFQLSTPSLRWVEVLELPHGDSFASPARLIHSLLEYNPEGFPGHRLKVEGRITHVGSNGSIYVADRSGGIRLEGVNTEGLQTGNSIQALGFLCWARANAVLQDVILRPSQAAPEVAPLAMTADASLSGLHDGRVIQVEAFLREKTLSLGDHILSLESGRTKFTAILEHPQAFALAQQLREGALVRLTGVCDIRWNEHFMPPNPEGMRLLLRSPSDITILRSAPWWTLARALALTVVLVFVLLMGTVWLVILQRQVRAQTEQLRKQMQQREALEEQLRQVQKLEGVGRLAGGVAHDFNNLLTVISGYCELLAMELPEGSDPSASVHEIKKAADRAAGLTKQLLAFSRKQILQPVVVDLNELVMDMNQMLRRLISEDIEFITRTNAMPCCIKVDPGQIGQVLMNLVVNARDAMPTGGRLILETSQVLLDATQAELRPDVTPGSYVQLTVADTGQGMDKATLDQIFEPFFTTKELGKGSGLGLSTVFGIVKQSGGHIWTYSELGYGTTFKIFFPCLQEPKKVEIKESLPGGNETLLVVEHQGEILRMICKTLEGSGYRILTTESVEEALAIAKRYTGPIHLLLTDVVMPGMNGKELATRIQALIPNIRVLYMSGYTESAVVQQGILDPGVAFLQKPFSARELTNRVIETLHGV